MSCFCQAFITTRVHACCSLNRGNEHELNKIRKPDNYELLGQECAVSWCNGTWRYNNAMKINIKREREETIEKKRESRGRTGDRIWRSVDRLLDSRARGIKTVEKRGRKRVGWLCVKGGLGDTNVRETQRKMITRKGMQIFRWCLCNVENDTRGERGQGEFKRRYPVAFSLLRMRCDVSSELAVLFSFFLFFFCVSGGSGGELSACDNASHAFNEFRVSAAKFALMERAASSIIASANVRLLRVALKWFVSDGRN